MRDSARLRVGRSRETPDIDRLYYVELTRAKLFSTGLLVPQVRDAAWFNYQWTLRHLDNVLLPTDGYSASLQLGGGYARATTPTTARSAAAPARLTFYRPFGRNWFGQARLEAAQVFAATRSASRTPCCFAPAAPIRCAAMPTAASGRSTTRCGHERPRAD